MNAGYRFAIQEAAQEVHHAAIVWAQAKASKDLYYDELVEVEKRYKKAKDAELKAKVSFADAKKRLADRALIELRAEIGATHGAL